MRSGLLAGDLVDTGDVRGVGTVVGSFKDTRWGFGRPIETRYMVVEFADGSRRLFVPLELVARRDETAACGGCGAVFERPAGSFRFARCGSCRDGDAPKRTLGSAA